jgi:sirohydrochlorin ferrochelatase
MNAMASSPAVSRRVLLMDNGSLEPASTLQLRRLAAALAARIGERVDPVSLAHSAKIPVEDLQDRPAELFEEALDRCVREGIEAVSVAPLFIGPSHAIVRHAPAVAARKKLKVTFAAPLFVEGETRLGEILADEVRATLIACKQAPAGEKPRIAIVDHGSPSRAVTDVRDVVAAQLRDRLGGSVREVAACSMERRPGAEFEFNEPLLENLLARDGWRSGPLVIALLFIAPGKHAGPAGDVAQIVRRVRGDAAIDDVKFTRAVGTHPRILEILAERVGTTM